MSVPAQQTGPTPAKVWATGDYADVCDRMIPALGARLVELLELSRVQSVLDVAAGSGNVALPAARRAANVTALDITPALLEAGRQRALSAGLDIDWVCGDALTMPFADASFDRVLSCVGVQFCADRAVAAGELIRVCKPGGQIGLIAWTPEGFIGQVLGAVAEATGAQSRPPTLDWGIEREVSGSFAAWTDDIAFKREHVTMPARTAVAWVDYMAASYGPLSLARTALEGRAAWGALRERLVGIAEAHDVAGNGEFAGRAEYLTCVVRL